MRRSISFFLQKKKKSRRGSIVKRCIYQWCKSCTHLCVWLMINPFQYFFQHIEQEKYPLHILLLTNIHTYRTYILLTHLIFHFIRSYLFILFLSHASWHIYLDFSWLFRFRKIYFFLFWDRNLMHKMKYSTDESSSVFVELI